MYTQHFGLNKRLFRAVSSGSNVFVGPQATIVIKALKKALATADAAVTVEGAAGVGKTTLVRRALEEVNKDRIVITIGRLQLGHDEILDLLLPGLGLRQIPKSVVQRFAVFRHVLQQYSDKDKRVLIVVEDATRIGTDALAELESLTAEDAGASEGANLILMGASGLKELLREPKLARLKQRVKIRQSVEPLPVNELLAYLKHSFRFAGGDFDSIFEDGAAEALHQFGKGIPRVVNNIVEQALTSAADNNAKRISVADLERAAKDDLGLTLGHDVAEIREAIAESAAAEAVPEPKAAPDPVEEDDEIPELIQDTLPEVAAIDPASVAPPKEDVPAAAEYPQHPANQPANEEIPAWEREATQAELRPDLDALERAMVVAQGGGTGTKKIPPAAPGTPAPDETIEVKAAAPEITLDKQIKAGIQEVTEARDQAPVDTHEQDYSAVDKPANTAPPAAPVTTTQEEDSGIAPADRANLEKIAVEMQKAKTIEDVDDKLAETLFGEEFNKAAAEVAALAAANPPIDVSANEDMQPETNNPAANGGHDSSPSQRLATVQALNKQKPPVASAPPASNTKIDSIEDQMNTSITQTRKALDPNRMPIPDDDDDDEDKGSKGGFLSRLRRS